MKLVISVKENDVNRIYEQELMLITEDQKEKWKELMKKIMEFANGVLNKDLIGNLQNEEDINDENVNKENDKQQNVNKENDDVNIKKIQESNKHKDDNTENSDGENNVNEDIIEENEDVIEENEGSKCID
jgi:hypothetical protein